MPAFHRALERLDAAAATLVPLAYLGGILIGTAAYFSGIILDAGIAVGLALAFAVEVHGFLAQRRVRATWARLTRLAADDPARAVVGHQFRVHVALLGFLVALSMYNGAAFLASTWPVAPGFLPPALQIAIRAVVLPALFVASGFLVPLHTSAGDVLRGASAEMLHRTVRATLRQWRRRIARAESRGLDLAPVAIALLLDAGDTEGARHVHLIAEGLASAEAGASQQGQHAQDGATSLPPTPPVPPERLLRASDGPSVPPVPAGRPLRSPAMASKPPTEQRARPTSPPLAGNVTPLRQGMGRPSRTDRRTAARANARSGRRGTAEARIRAALARQPDLTFDALVRDAGVSESTASKWLAVLRTERRTEAGESAAAWS